MRNAIATKERVFGAASALAAAGVVPTVDKVRAKVGGGSFTTINDLLGEYERERRAEALKASEVPVEIRALSQNLALKAATEIYVQVNDAAAARIASARAEAEQQAASANERCDDALVEVTRLEGEIKDCRTSLEAARQDAERARLLAAEADGKVSAQSGEISRLSGSLSSALAAQRTAEEAAAELRALLREAKAQLLETRTAQNKTEDTK